MTRAAAAPRTLWRATRPSTKCVHHHYQTTFWKMISYLASKMTSFFSHDSFVFALTASCTTTTRYLASNFSQNSHSQLYFVAFFLSGNAAEVRTRPAELNFCWLQCLCPTALQAAVVWTNVCRFANCHTKLFSTVTAALSNGLWITTVLWIKYTFFLRILRNAFLESQDS